MKRVFKFAAMAFAAVAMLAACNKDENPADNSGNGGNEPAALTIDGKQWMTDMQGTGVFIDLGVKKAGMSYSGYCDPETYVSMMGMSLGEYTVVATDAASGTINVEGVDMYTGEPATMVFRYKDLTESSVKIDFGIVYGMPTEGDEIAYADFTLVPTVIDFEDMYENM